MKRLTLALLLVAASCGDDPGDHGWGGGGGPAPSTRADASTAVDAAPRPDGGGPTADAQTGTGIFGKLCEAGDLRAPEACPPSSAFGGVIVAHAESGNFIAAAATGEFMLPPVAGNTRATVRAAPDDPVFRRSLVPVPLVAGGAGPLRIPVVRDADWITLTNTVGAANVDFDAVVFVYVIDRDDDGNVVPITGALASAPTGDIYFDDGGPLQWRASDLVGTGAAGVIWVNAIRPPLTELDMTVIDGARSVNLTQIPLEPDGITFVTADFGSD